jgi:hypothetical protein
MELVTLPARSLARGRDATELVVSFRRSARMRDVAVRVLESDTEIVVRVQAQWEPVADASGGWFSCFHHASECVALARPLGDRRLLTVVPASHC